MIKTNKNDNLLTVDNMMWVLGYLKQNTVFDTDRIERELQIMDDKVKELSVLKQHLKEIEWAAVYNGWNECPACNQLCCGGGHKPDCWLFNAIKEDD